MYSFLSSSNDNFGDEKHRLHNIILQITLKNAQNVSEFLGVLLKLIYFHSFQDYGYTYMNMCIVKHSMEEKSYIV